jgi:hypothetical protein
VLSRKRGSETDDPTLIRHLYDLAALEKVTKNSKDFPSLVKTILEKDTKRGKISDNIMKMSVLDRVQESLHILETDSEYPVEYDQFVIGMSYASKRPSFQDSIQAVHRIVDSL